MATLKDIARIANVNVSTVSKALRNSSDLSEQTKLTSIATSPIMQMGLKIAAHLYSRTHRANRLIMWVDSSLIAEGNNFTL